MTYYNPRTAKGRQELHCLAVWCRAVSVIPEAYPPQLARGLLATLDEINRLNRRLADVEAYVRETLDPDTP